MLLTLFLQSYKGFKKNFFKFRSNRRDPALLDGFPLYWTEKPILQKLQSLEDLSPKERGVCELLSGLSAPFSTLELLKCEFSPKNLKIYIGTSSFYASCLNSFLLAYLHCCCFNLLSCVQIWALITIRRRSWPTCWPNERRRLPRRERQRPLPPRPQLLLPVDRPEGVVVIETDDEETCTDLVFKRSRVGGAVAPSNSASGGPPTFMDHPPSASSPLPLVVHKGG